MPKVSVTTGIHLGFTVVVLAALAMYLLAAFSFPGNPAGAR